MLSPGFRNSKRVEDKDHSIQVLEVSKFKSVIFNIYPNYSKKPYKDRGLSHVNCHSHLNRQQVNNSFPISYQKSFSRKVDNLFISQYEFCWKTFFLTLSPIQLNSQPVCCAWGLSSVFHRHIWPGFDILQIFFSIQSTSNQSTYPARLRSF